MPHPGTWSVGAELPQDFIRQDGGPTESLSEAPGACGCNRGDSSIWLLHMRPSQHWLYGRVPRWAWQRGTHLVQITPACSRTFSVWTDPSFLPAEVPMEQVSRHTVSLMDASATGLGATYNGHAVFLLCSYLKQVVALRGPVQSQLAASLTPNSPESSLTRQSLSSHPALQSPDVSERPVPGVSANEFLKSGVRLVPI